MSSPEVPKEDACAPGKKEKFILAKLTRLSLDDLDDVRDVCESLKSQVASLSSRPKAKEKVEVAALLFLLHNETASQSLLHDASAQLLQKAERVDTKKAAELRPTDESETSGKREEIGSNGPANHEHSGAVEGETEDYVESLKDHNGSAFAENIIKTNDNSEIDKVVVDLEENGEPLEVMNNEAPGQKHESKYAGALQDQEPRIELKKRAAPTIDSPSADNNTATTHDHIDKKPKKEYIPFVGDWKCNCNHWNHKFHYNCSGMKNGQRCSGNTKETRAALQENEGAYEGRFRHSPPAYEAWFCTAPRKPKDPRYNWKTSCNHWVSAERTRCPHCHSKEPVESRRGAVFVDHNELQCPATSEDVSKARKRYVFFGPFGEEYLIIRYYHYRVDYHKEPPHFTPVEI